MANTPMKLIGMVSIIANGNINELKSMAVVKNIITMTSSRSR